MTTTTSSSRESWLTKVLGEDAGAAVQRILGRQREELQQATGLLDEAGFERKALTVKAEGDPEPPPPPVEQPPPPRVAENDPVLQVAGTLAESIKTAVEGDYSKLTDETLTAMLADAMRAAMPGEETPPPPPEAPPQEEQPAMAEDAKAFTETGKAITETLGQMVKDQGEMARGQVQLAADMKALKELLPTVVQLVADVKQIQTELGSKPRAASEASETEIPPSPLALSIESDIQKGLQGGKKTFLGVEVNNIPG